MRHKRKTVIANLQNRKLFQALLPLKWQQAKYRRNTRPWRQCCQRLMWPTRKFYKNKISFCTSWLLRWTAYIYTHKYTCVYISLHLCIMRFFGVMMLSLLPSLAVADGTTCTSHLKQLCTYINSTYVCIYFFFVHVKMKVKL